MNERTDKNSRINKYEFNFMELFFFYLLSYKTCYKDTIIKVMMVIFDDDIMMMII